MPIFDLGYRAWEGELRPRALRWWTISRDGIALAWKPRFLRWLLSFAWTPLFYFAPLFFAIGYATDPVRDLSPGSLWFEFMRGFLGPGISERLQHDPESIRPAAWSLAFFYFFSYSQAWLMMLVVAIVGPPLIARDVQSKAFLLYFSKPIGRLDYLLGKAGTVLGYVWMVTLFPALVLYAISIAFSPSLAAFFQTSATIVRVVGSCLVISVPATLIVLFLSSLTGDPRFSRFGWIAVWTIGELSYALLSNLPGFGKVPWVFLLSLRKCASVVTESIFDVQGQLRDLGTSRAVERLLKDISSPYSPTLGLLWLAGISLFCLAVLYRRISAPMRI